jgi:hypothetical protein
MDETTPSFVPLIVRGGGVARTLAVGTSSTTTPSRRRYRKYPVISQSNRSHLNKVCRGSQSSSSSPMLGIHCC